MLQFLQVNIMKRILLGLFFITQGLFAQFGNGNYNHIGITVGATQTSLFTDQLNTKPEMSWIAGLSIRGNYYNNFAMVYGMHFTESKFSVETHNGIMREDVDVKAMSGQIYLLLSYKIAGSFVTLDFGPALQFNGKLSYDKSKENQSLVGQELLRLKNIEKISTFNGLAHAGLTAGFENIRLNVSYQYGFTNFLGAVNDQKEVKDLGVDKLKGNTGTIIGAVIFYF